VLSRSGICTGVGFGDSVSCGGADADCDDVASEFVVDAEVVDWLALMVLFRREVLTMLDTSQPTISNINSGRKRRHDFFITGGQFFGQEY
jgi:hypothetical protein